MLKRLRWTLILTGTVALGCRDLSLPTTPVTAPETQPSSIISDAVHEGGTPGFFFLPPMVSQPSVNGTFDGDIASLNPRIAICDVSSSSDVDCGSSSTGATAAAVVFTTTTTPAITLDPSGPQYQVNWDTQGAGFAAGHTYRVHIIAGVTGARRELGLADVLLTTTPGQAKRAATGDIILLQDGRTLPIHFRIETGIPGAVTVNPQAATVFRGKTQQFVASLADLHGATLTGPPVSWSTSNPAVATIDQTGLASGVGIGGSTITATASGVSGSAALTGTDGFVMVSAGGDITCGVTPSGKAYCWGDGQLGSGTLDPGIVPRAVAGGLSFTTLSVGGGTTGGGGTHACGVTTSGQAYCWGKGYSGELGAGSTASSSVPVAVAGGLSFVAVTSGFGHTCGLTTAGQAYCWGANYSGQLGNGSFANSLVPVAVGGGLNFAMVSAGEAHTCAVTTSGQGYCWGSNGHGQLGNGSSDPSSSSQPVAVTGGLTFSGVSAGEDHTCGVTTGGQAYCWGSALFGATGGEGLSGGPTPFPVNGGLTFAAVSAGTHFTCGVTRGGQAYCWGAGSNFNVGQIGDGFIQQRDSPAAVIGGLSFSGVSAATYHACGVTTDRKAYCWGYGSYLGNGNYGDSSFPVPVAFP